MRIVEGRGELSLVTRMVLADCYNIPIFFRMARLQDEYSAISSTKSVSFGRNSHILFLSML